MLTQAISTTSRTAAAVHQLVKTAGGEYTAASVDANPSLAAGLIKVKDGNYVYPIVSAADRAGGIDVLNTLKLGG